MLTEGDPQPVDLSAADIRLQISGRMVRYT